MTETAAPRPLTVALLECVTPADVVSVIVERGVALLGADAGLIALETEDRLSLEIVQAQGYSAEITQAWQRFSLAESLPLSDAVREKKALFFHSRADLEACYPEMFESGPIYAVQASASLPLVSRGRAFGGLHFSFSQARGGFTEAEQEGLQELTRQAALALERALLLVAVERERKERERLVAELKAANLSQRESLQESEESFRLLVEGVQDYAIFMLDPEGYVTTWNAGAERFNGYKAGEIIGEHFSRFYSPEDIARRHPWNELEIAAREGRYEEEGWRIRKDGTRFWASVVITALRGKDGRLRGFGKVTRDFTERRLREQERANAEVMAQQRRFLKDVLASVTQGKLRLCDTPSELPAPLPSEFAGQSILLTRQALKAVRTRVVAAADACGISRENMLDLVTAASECAMNAVQHAGGGMARVYGDADAGRVQVWLEDKGKGIDLSDIPRATLEPGFTTGGGGIGHGFSLMTSCCERIYLLTGASQESSPDSSLSRP